MKNEDLNRLIKDIAKKEKEKYNISFSLETPTVIDYYKEHLNNKTYNLYKKINQIRIGYKASGVTFYKPKKIVIFDKNFRFHRFIKNPVDSIKSGINNEIITVLATLHEIRHIMQYQKDDIYSNYERFCTLFLKPTEEKYKLNREIHNSLYHEIDAILYSCEKIKDYVELNTKQRKYIDEQRSKGIYQKNIYDFEKYFNYFCKNRVKWAMEKSPNFINIFWNEDTTFKRPSEIKNDPRFLIKNSLSTKILGSNAYLFSLLDKDLTDDEFVFINYEIQLNKKDIEERIIKNNSLYEKNKISKKDYIQATKYFKELLIEKDKYLKIITENNLNNYRSKHK